MIKYLVITVSLLVVLSGLYRFGFKEREIEIENYNPNFSVHYYNNSDVPLGKIKIKAFYFVPKNRTENLYSDWESVLRDALDDLVSFHRSTFRNLSQVTFEIYPRPVAGLNENIFYDTEVTDRGNPEALKSIYYEIEKRLLKEGGDLYDKKFVEGVSGEYVVYYLMYEGVGASGSENVALISRTFLTEEEYKGVGSSIFYHEFAHTLGIPDHYDDDGHVDSFDIMGFGLRRPLGFNYLDRIVLEKMGL